MFVCVFVCVCVCVDSNSSKTVGRGDLHETFTDQLGNLTACPCDNFSHIGWLWVWFVNGCGLVIGNTTYHRNLVCLLIVSCLFD